MRDLARRGGHDFSTWSAFRPQFGELEGWFHDMERLFGSPLSGAVRHGTAAMTPQLTTTRTDDGYRITADLPGFTDKDVNLDVHNGVLTLSGERSVGNWADHNAVRRERSALKFSASVRLPEDADFESVEAKLTDGVLSVTAAHREEVKPRQIQIQAG